MNKANWEQVGESNRERSRLAFLGSIEVKATASLFPGQDSDCRDFLMVKIGSLKAVCQAMHPWQA
jgi:hypothetical protein